MTYRDSSSHEIGTHRLLHAASALIVLGAALPLLGSCAVLRPGATKAFGAARTEARILGMGPIEVPDEQRPPASSPGDQQEAVMALIRAWAERPLPSWKENGKVQAPRILLAKLALERDIPEVNAYLQAAEPWAGIGSTWTLRKSGDYDFSLPGLTAILYQYGERPELLYPETRTHLLDVLLNQEGGDFNTTVPGSMRLVTETENHILMTEGARYLKNQWLHEHNKAGHDADRYDNAANGLQDKLVAFIREIEQAGPYEFNSVPYSGYTIMALLTLEAFADEPVAVASRSLLDRMNWEYALGSLQLRRYPPFRRQPRRAEITDLTKHPHSAIMRVWLSQAGHGPFPVADNEHHAVYAALMPYRLPEETAGRALAVDRRHFVRIGRGPGASPELYAAGPGYLLSAGGTGRPKGSLIVARPIVLLLNDGAEQLSEVFTIGASGDYTQWNNTGVLRDFAVGRGPLRIPRQYTPLTSGDTWAVYHHEGLLIAAGERSEADESSVAALYLQPLPDQADAAGAAAELQRSLERLTPGEQLSAGRATLPDGRDVGFDLTVGADQWLIRAINGSPTQHSVISWPRLSGTLH